MFIFNLAFDILQIEWWKSVYKCEGNGDLKLVHIANLELGILNLLYAGCLYTHAACVRLRAIVLILVHF